MKQSTAIDILQIIVEEGFVRVRDIVRRSGYGASTVEASIWHLCRIGLAERKMCRVTATERGKIAYAIIVGKRTRKASQWARSSGFRRSASTTSPPQTIPAMP